MVSKNTFPLTQAAGQTSTFTLSRRAAATMLLRPAMRHIDRPVETPPVLSDSSHSFLRQHPRNVPEHEAAPDRI